MGWAVAFVVSPVVALQKDRALRCSTRQAVGSRRLGSRFCSQSGRSASERPGDVKAVYADRLAKDEAAGKES